MRNIRNLTWFVLALVLTIWSGLAFSQTVYPYPAKPLYRANTQAINVNGPYYESRAAACDAFLAAYNAATTDTGKPFTVKQCDASLITLTSRTGANRNVGSWAPIIYKCHLGGKRPNNLSTVCHADPSYPDIPDTPEPEPQPPVECKADGDVFTGNWKVGSNSPPSVTYNPMKDAGATDGGCCVRVIRVKRCYTIPSSSDPNAAFCTFEYVRDGNKCPPSTGSPPPDTSPPPSDADRKDVPPLDSPKGPCPTGTVQVGVNADGVPRCQGTGSDPKNPKPKPPTVEKEDTKDNGDGSSTTTKTTVTKNADGSTTTVTTKTTTGADGTKTSTESRDTTKAPSGDSGKDDSKEDDEKYDLCKQNPYLAICKNSSVSGKCGEISCDGDAIQCATLRAAAAMQCKQQSDEDFLKASPLTTKGNAAINGSDLEGLPNSKNAQVTNIPTLGSQGWLGNGAAFKDVAITVQGKQIVVPLSKWSEYLLPFRYIMMIIASLISYRILAGALVKA